MKVSVVAGLSGSSLCTLDANPSWDVSDLKWEVELKTDINECEQRLLFLDRVLEDTEKLFNVFSTAAVADDAHAEKAIFEVKMIRLNPKWVRLKQDLRNGRCKLRDFDEDVSHDRELVLVALNHAGCALQEVPEEFRADREMVLAAVRRDGLAITYASEALRDDLEVASAAVSQNGFALELISKRLQGNRDIVNIAIEREGLSWKFMSLELKSDREIMLAALRSNSDVLLEISPELTKDPEIVFAARQGVRIRGGFGNQYFQNLLRRAQNQPSS